MPSNSPLPVKGLPPSTLMFQLNWAGVMATAGGLVFGGSNEGNVFALDASTGKALWDFQTGGAVRTNPMGFAVDGKQRVVSTGGSTLYVFGLE